MPFPCFQRKPSFEGSKAAVDYFRAIVDADLVVLCEMRRQIARPKSGRGRVMPLV